MCIDQAVELATRLISLGALALLFKFIDAVVSRTTVDASGVKEVKLIRRMYERTLASALIHYAETNAEVVKTVLQRCPLGPRVSSDVFSEACTQQHPDIISVLLEQGNLDLNKGTEDTLPLLSVIRRRDIRLVGIFLDAGADLNLTSAGLKNNKTRYKKIYRSPLDYAFDYSWEIVEYLVQRGATVSHPEKWYEGLPETTYDALKTARITQTGEVQSYADIGINNDGYLENLGI
jgi:hypothetical protein